MKVLYITQSLPFSEDSGGRIKTSNTVKLLIKKHNVHLVSFQSISEYPSSKNKRLTIKTFKNPNINIRFINVIPLLIKSLLSPTPFEVKRYYSKQMKEYVESIANKNEIDAIHIDHLNMSQFLPPFKKCLWVLEEHNIDSDLFMNIFQKEKGLFRLFYLIEAIKFKLYENKVLNKFDKIISISDRDKRSLIRKGISINKITTLPILLKTKNLFKFHKKDKLITFIGSLSWPPNKSGILWFISKVWPQIINQIPNVKLAIVGNEASNRFKKTAKSSQNTRLIENANNNQVENILSNTSLIVVPIKTSGGVKIKTLMGLSHGIPIVSTPQGIEGTNVKKNTHALVSSSPKIYAKHCIDVISDKNLSQKLSENGINFIKTYNNKHITESKIKSIYE